MYWEHTSTSLPGAAVGGIVCHFAATTKEGLPFTQCSFAVSTGVSPP